MKLKSLSAILIAGTSFVALGYAIQLPDGGRIPSQEPEPVTDPFHQIAAANGVIAINLGGSDSHQQMGVLDTERRVLSVYRVDRQSGEIALQSVRNLTWDLQLDEFNGVRPLPKELSGLLDMN